MTPYAYTLTRNQPPNDLASMDAAWYGTPPRRYKLRVVILAAALAAFITAAAVRHSYSGCIAGRDIDAKIAQALRTDDGLIDPLTGR